MKFKWIGINEDETKVELVKLDKFTIPSIEFANIHNSSNIRTAVVLDLETTGRDTQTCEIIEIAARKIYFDQISGNIKWVSTEVFSQLQQPGAPLTETIVRLTSLTDEQLHGHSIDWNSFRDFIKKSDLFISHNAAFDRPIFERYTDICDVPWACSMRNVAWDKKGYDSLKLSTLCIYHGFFYDGHRALTDVNALIHLLTFQDIGNEKSYFSELILDAFIPRKIIILNYTDFQVKDVVKLKGYLWSAPKKKWFKVVRDASFQEELLALRDLVSAGNVKYEVADIPIHDTYRHISKIF